MGGRPCKMPNQIPRVWVESRRMKNAFNSTTCDEVVRHAIIPLTKHKKSSYVQVQNTRVSSGEIFDVSMDDARDRFSNFFFCCFLHFRFF